jgi:hypothetical protein
VAIASSPKESETRARRPGALASSTAGGSVELRFGPQRPDDAEPSNWIQTVPGRAWFAYLRLYAPTQPYFDRTWPLNDIQPA